MCSKMKVSRNNRRENRRPKKNAPKIFQTYMKQKLALTFLLVALVLFGLAVAVGVIVGKNGKDYSVER